MNKFIVFGVACLLVIFGLSVCQSTIKSVYGQDNKTFEFDDKGWPKILDDNDWR